MTHPTSTVRPTAEPLLRHLVGAILRTRREDQGRTLRDVAESARVSVAYLSEVERGRKEPSSEVLVAVCRALGLRMVDLVGAAHAELARMEGRVVVDLTAPATADLVATRTDLHATSADLVASGADLLARSGQHELATVTRLADRAPTTSPAARAFGLGDVRVAA